MRISTIAMANLRRRKSRALFLVIGISIGMATVTALLSLSSLIREEIGLQLDQFGANIIVVPKSNNLQLDYGGISVSGVSFDASQLKDDDLEKLKEIPYRNRLSVVAPKILGASEVEGQQVLLAGVDFSQELKLKRWWRLVGEKPKNDDNLLLGYDAAKALSLIEPSMEDRSKPVTGNGAAVTEENRGHNHAAESKAFKLRRERLTIAGREFRIAGVLQPTGGREDSFVMGSLASIQQLLGLPHQLSLIEVSALCKDCPVDDIVAQIGQKLPNAKVTALQQSVRSRTEAVERLTRFAFAVSGVVLLIGALSSLYPTLRAARLDPTEAVRYV